ncbi:Ribitol 2-dehydrogenase [Anatilimnocola aggregata]|uniref:Ribitol 2-dehydrogenase n=1 Tax=Anatilimnocola aggregata TaxID=2528021 RepID=A0A517YMI1_9BACT|nr:SDR family NAD(P)-dependent oxidoreductase [Anatilimnocola aggregata]QDU31424.1 Ribitol 2-dehydrogenase [Anatilimnocola aggregata]
MSWSFANASAKHALVTGASSGLGLAIVRQLTAAGTKVALVARDAAKLQQTIAALQLPAEQTLAIAADITQQADVDRLAATVEQTWGQLDLLVNCAGKSSRGKIEETTPEQFQELWELNFLAAVRCTRALLPPLLASQGHVVQIGSLASKSTSKFLGAYPAGKFALAAYSQQLRLELGDRGLHVLLVCPGPIARDDAGSRYDTQAADLPAEARQPGGGVKLKGIQPDDLARRILRACERRQPELIVPAKARLLFTISQLWPTLGDWLTNRLTGK